MNSTASSELKEVKKEKIRVYGCWQCIANNMWHSTPLYKVGDFDYVCAEHIKNGKPPIEDISWIMTEKLLGISNRKMIRDKMRKTRKKGNRNKKKKR